MISLHDYEIWFITGSQHLYGDEALNQVNQHSEKIVEALNKSGGIAIKIVFKPVVTTADEIYNLLSEANVKTQCVGLIAWMHTFSPAKMWIRGLKVLQKPFLHLHTQFNRDIPWSEIDMDFMNLNQSAHGGREFGFIGSRMGIDRKVVVGHWQDQAVSLQVDTWARAACAWQDAQGAKFARFGDNMRQVAVTEGDKVGAQMKFGYEVNGYGMGDLVAYVENTSASAIDDLIHEYEEKYHLVDALKKGGIKHESLREAAKIEIGLRKFLEQGEFKGFTDTFENLHGLMQLPGIAVQRLMAEGYGFGAEGDWKTAALVRSMKVMSVGKEGGTSFMEDYTYHLDPSSQKVLGAHMLEICESIAEGKPSCEIHPLSIGGKADPVRLVFDVSAGPAINASIIDMGNRYRLLINEVDTESVPEPLPNLPVARTLWKPRPDLKTAASAWILAGGAHHTGYSKALTSEHMQDFAEMAGIETLMINDKTQLFDFKQQLKWNEMYYHWKS